MENRWEASAQQGDHYGDGSAERYNLFHDDLMDFYWDYDNNGLRLLQLRFYPVSSNVN